MSFHSCLRDELLRETEFEPCVILGRAARYGKRNTKKYRPHSTLGGLVPCELSRRSAFSMSITRISPGQKLGAGHCQRTQLSAWKREML
jgi:hypothetical protein